MPERPHDRLLLIAARAPVPGATKTRLGATIGKERATCLYRAFLHDLAGRFMTADLGYDVGWAFTPESAPFAPVIAAIRPDLAALVEQRDAMRFVQQRGDDWASRQAHLLAWGAKQGYTATVLTASDSPQMSRAMVADAFAALQSADVVVGRVHDGGYYLVGVRGDHDVVSGVPMSTSSAADALIAQAEARGLHVATVAPSFDIDVEADLDLLARCCARDPEAAPATCRTLHELGLPRYGTTCDDSECVS